MPATKAKVIEATFGSGPATGTAVKLINFATGETLTQNMDSSRYVLFDLANLSTAWAADDIIGVSIVGDYYGGKTVTLNNTGGQDAGTVTVTQSTATNFPAPNW